MDEAAAIDRDEGAAREAVSGPNALAIGCDVSKSAEVQAAIAATLAKFGRLTVLCKIAGGSAMNDARVTDAPEEEFRRAISVDLFGRFLTCRK